MYLEELKVYCKKYEVSYLRVLEDIIVACESTGEPIRSIIEKAKECIANGDYYD